MSVSWLFDESENAPFEVSPGRTKIYDKKSLPDAPRLYILQENKSACVVCSFSYALFFIGDKIDADCFKDEIITSIRSSNRLKFAQYVALNRAR